MNGDDASTETDLSRLQRVGGRAARSWADAVLRAARWADGIDNPGAGLLDGLPGRDPAEVLGGPDVSLRTETTVSSDDGPGRPAVIWAATKTTVSLVAAPVTVPTLTVAAMRTARATAERIKAFPDHLHALAEDGELPLPLDRTLRRPASERYLITSDLHRCIPGRLDWPRRQRVKQLYLDVLAGYAEEGWHLIENGDVEDFWMVGGSTWGAVYDVAFLTGTAVGPGRAEARRKILGEQLDRIVDNNREIYELLRTSFCDTGRYHRTMGNHDDAYADPGMVEHLRTHLPNVEMADSILLEHDGATPADGVEGIAAYVLHGHLTDSWNGPGFASLGRAITWLSTGLDDLPQVRKLEPLPDEEGLGRLLGGNGLNRLIRVDPRYGGNRRFDSLDEERLFARLAETEPAGGWPWLIFGHTHFPMLTPQNAAGEQVKYANSGCGVLDGAFSALEWDGSDPDDPLRLVVWVDEPGGPQRFELKPDGPTFLPV